MDLYSYYRSPACHRVRIALHYKEIPFRHHGVHLVKNGGEQHTAEYKALNPQMLVPALADGKTVITQSAAILEYLDEKHPDPPILPRKPADRAFARQIAQVAACDMHPLTTLRVLNYLSGELNVSHTQRMEWHRHWLQQGFDAVEKLLESHAARRKGPFCCGDHVTVADICLVPQVCDARRYDMPVENWPLIAEIEKHCAGLPAFLAAAPENQPDTPEDQRRPFPKGRPHGG